MYELLTISDLHLGAYVARCADVSSFVTAVPSLAKKLVIIGDLTDATAGVEFTDEEMVVFSTIQGLHDGGVEVVRIPGNHDPVPEEWSLLLNVTAAPADGIEVVSGGRKIKLIHGHQWDHSLTWSPFVTRLAITGSRALGHVSSRAARWVKSWEKRLRGVSPIVKAGALAYKQAGGYDAIIVGHSHVAEAVPEQGFFNDGACCENDPMTYCGVLGGEVTLNKWEPLSDLPVPGEAGSRR